MTLTQKERELLKDLKGQETLSVQKFNRHSANAADAQLKTLFGQIAQCEQKHLDAVTQLEQGQVPQMNSAPDCCRSFSGTYSISDTTQKKNDSYLCADVLSMEKQASHLYDTCIFEFKDAQYRNLLNRIQKDKQCHGKLIYDYMSANNMYC